MDQAMKQQSEELLQQMKRVGTQLKSLFGHLSHCQHVLENAPSYADEIPSPELPCTRPPSPSSSPSPSPSPPSEATPNGVSSNRNCYQLATATEAEREEKEEVETQTVAIAAKKRVRGKRAGKKQPGGPPVNVSRLRDFWRSGENELQMGKPIFSVQKEIRTELVNSATGEPVRLKRHQVQFMLAGEPIIVHSKEGVWFESGRGAKNDVALCAVQFLEKYVEDNL
jgi:hypothetical protein